MLNTSGLAPSNRQAPLPAPYARAEGTPEIVARVLRKVWYDFSQWKKDMARSSLRSLQPPTQSPWDGLPLLPSVPVPKTNAPLQCKRVEASDFTVLEFTDDGDLAQDPWTLQSGSTLDAPKSFDSVPVYENFTPADRSIYVGNDNNDVPYVCLRNSNDISYVRYIDDPKYDAARELDDWHGTLAWMDLKDHEFGLLVLETARRLFVEHGIPYEQQQATDILPLPLFTATDMITGVIRPGLLDEYTKRDLGPFPRTGLDRMHDSSDFSTMFGAQVMAFCPSVNCVTPNCPTHNYEYDPALRITPYVSNLPPRGSCGPVCFRKSALAEAVSWDPDDYSLLRTILEVSPEASPCDLAVICLKPCNEVHRLAKFITKSFPAPRVPLPSKPPPATEFRDTSELMLFTPNPPCSHVGPCTRKSNCPCAMNRAHCTRVCRCHLQCTRRWSGCKCTPGEDGHACGDKRACPCRLASRECDPELCIGCASRDHTLGRCMNSQIQHKKRKKTTLRKSQFGTGVFAAERIQAGELVCEYVGELVYDETTRSRELLAIHRRSNYLFGLNPQFGIDAVHAGNEARFVNHQEHDNVAAYIKLVNGEPRIGLYANRTIRPGAELFIDYGRDFFKHNEAKEDSELESLASFVDASYEDTQEWIPSQ